MAKVCATPGCPELTHGTSHCTTHRRAHHRRHDARRGTPTQRGYDAAHRRNAADQVARVPWCANCKQTATQVAARGDQLTGDHIIPLSAGGTNERSNYQTLCGRCNASKGGTNRPRPPEPRGVG